jgi:hypothetical protein
MYSKKKDSMTIPLSVYMWHKKTETTALLDSGATHNFINKRAVSSLGLGTRSLPHPLQVNNIDGTINSEGSITQYCNLWIRQGTKTVKLGFYITNLVMTLRGQTVHDMRRWYSVVLRDKVSLSLEV